MPKQKSTKRTSSTKSRSSKTSTASLEQENDLCNTTNISSNQDEEDFLDKTTTTMNKRRSHLQQFYDRSNIASGWFLTLLNNYQSFCTNLIDKNNFFLLDLTDSLDTESSEFNKTSSINTKTSILINNNKDDPVQTISYESNNRSLTSDEPTTNSRSLYSNLSTNNSTTRGLVSSQSLCITRTNSSNSYSNNEKTKCTVINNAHDHSSTNCLLLTQKSIDEADDQIQT